MTQLGTTLAPLVERVYGDRAAEVTARLVDLAARWRPRLSARRPLPFDNRTSVLITYGNTVRRPGEPGLCTLAEVLAKDVGAVVSDVHLLPLYPSTSDDGFAVVDHRRIDARLGDWEDVAALGATHGVILDFVANHVSASSPWFRAFLAGDPAYADFFVTRDPAFDASQVVRPRTTPLFHTYRRPDGSPVEVWTTFGPDQVDVNVANPEVLLALTDILLGYVARGARAVRLDAIGFLWKASGTRCIHLPQTHAIIKLWRVLLDGLAPGTCLLTETNVPHLENVAYFGNGSDEANLVYQFALPPLTLHSFVAGDASALTGWASAVGRVSGTATWFNFLASHDGIGMRASHGILDESQQEALVERTRAVGGRVSLAATADGSEVYEPQRRLPGRAVHTRGAASPGPGCPQGGCGPCDLAVDAGRSGDLCPFPARLRVRPDGHGPHRAPASRQPGGARRRSPGAGPARRSPAAADVHRDRPPAPRAPGASGLRSVRRAARAPSR